MTIPTHVGAEGHRMDWADVFKMLFGATAAALIAALVAYFKSIGAKADQSKVEEQLKNLRAEFEKQLTQQRTDFSAQITQQRAELGSQIEALTRRHSAWETKTERFATREMVTEMKQDLQRLEDKFEGHFKDMTEKIMKALEKK